MYLMAYRRSDSRRRLIDPAFNRPFTNGPLHSSDGMIAYRSMWRSVPSSSYEYGFKVERIRFITREYVRANPDKTFLFGDNLLRRGYGGQAAAVRGEPNAVGIPTKKKPSMGPDAFFTDAEFEQNKAAIDRAFATLAEAVTDSSRTIVVPSDGLGTGRAQMQKRAPKTFAYLQKRLDELARRE